MKEKNKKSLLIKFKGNDLNKKTKKKFAICIMILSTLVILIFFAFSSYTFNLLSSLNNKSGNDSVKPIEVGKNQPVNILLMGVDIGIPGVPESNNHTRTDTLLLMNYNPKNNNVNLVSIPRDTFILINGRSEKINAANAFGGVPCAIDAVEKLLDVKINYYAKLDFAGFNKIIDTIGGVDMTIAQNMDYDDTSQDLHIHFNKGETVHLDGKMSEEFFRWRENNNGTGFADGDLGRIKNQHLFIEKVVEKFKSPSIIPKIPSIAKIIPNYVDTNMSPKDILSYGLVITKLDKENLNMVTLKGEPKYIDGISYFLYDEDKNKDILATLHDTAKVSVK